ncbi:MAG TPA: pitrilysin family protein [Kofleriaceae bacterium]|nr:pitrilysin family protein [Kofleriaceae bacterium]
MRVFGLCLLAGCALGATPPPSPPRRTDLGLAVSMSQLPNGLRVVLVRDARAPEVSVTMRYAVGAIDDGAHPGIAHMAEHLMYQQVIANESLFTQLEEHATYFNGGTTYDATTYLSRAPRAELDRLLSIEGLRLQLRCTTITDAIFERERAVVVNEIRERDDSTQLLSAINASVFPDGHPYRQSIGGSEESLHALQRADVCAFIDAHYAPENAALVIAGNLTPEEVEVALSKLVAKIPRRRVAPSGYVPALPTTAHRADATAPLDDEALLVTWPLPIDPGVRTQVRAIAAALPYLINGEISGSVSSIELGDEGARVIGIVAFPASDESPWKVKEKVESTIVELSDVFDPKWRLTELDQIGFDYVRQRAIYRLYRSLEDPPSRDQMLADFALAGRDPSAALAAEFEGLRQLTQGTARDLVTRYLSIQGASFVTLKPETGKKRGHKVELAADIHDVGQRRTTMDPAKARQPADVAVPEVAGITTKRLANGMQVVLLPLNSVPTVDVRLVFSSGTADDPADKHGAAKLAAYGLGWNIRYINDLLAFAAAGGSNDIKVTTDHTTFSSAGIDMHIDYLLAGLRRWVRDGTYQRGTEGLVDAMRAAAKEEIDVDSTVADTWNAALYGSGHPYTATGLRHMAATLGDADAERFRREHYTPDNATLVISGRFDAALTERWVEFLFGDWSGHAVKKPLPRATLRPASIGLVEDIQQAQLRIALPTASTNRAAQLVVAQMLADIAADIRQQLGASYGVHAILGEERLATEYVLAGWVDQSRAPAAAELIAQRIAELHTDAGAAAQAFVIARRRVLVRLGALTASAEALGEWVEHDVDLGRAALSDVALAQQVRALTIDSLAGSLAELDLTRGVVFVRGPADSLKQAFAVLHRDPTLVQFDQAKRDSVADDPLARVEQAAAKSKPRREQEDISYLEPALTEQAPRTRLTMKLMPFYIMGHLVESSEASLQIECCTGAGVAAELGMRRDKAVALGLHVGVGYVSGYRYSGRGSTPNHYEVTDVPIDVAAFIQRTAYDRLWATLLLGVHLDQLYKQSIDIYADDERGLHGALGIGLEGGLDLWKGHPHRLGIAARVQGALISSSGYGALSVGLAYRQ